MIDAEALNDEALELRRIRERINTVVEESTKGTPRRSLASHALGRVHAASQAVDQLQRRLEVEEAGVPPVPVIGTVPLNAA